MKVLVVNNAAPFVRGGAEELADHLVRELNATPGVESELMRIPFSWTPSERLIDEIVLNRSLHLWGVDRVVGLKFPAYLVPHREKVLWVLHQFRQAYDLGDAGQGLGDTGREREIKDAIRAADNACFDAAKALYVNSPVTRERMARYNGREAQVLYPPVNDPELFTGGEAQDYVFAGGRVAPGKRQHLLIEAMADVPGSGRLMIAGPAEADYGHRIQARVAELGLESRVQLNFGFHPRADLARWINEARAVAYLPYDEDSLGYVSMEAFAAGKPVLTTTDAGGLLEMVGEATGIVVEPQPAALAEGLATLLGDPGRAAKLGAAARDDLQARGLTWPSTITRLLS